MCVCGRGGGERRQKNDDVLVLHIPIPQYQYSISSSVASSLLRRRGKRGEGLQTIRSGLDLQTATTRH